MAKFIKLTTQQGQVFWLNTSMILTFASHSDGGGVQTSVLEGTRPPPIIYVTETPEQILALINDLRGEVAA